MHNGRRVGVDDRSTVATTSEGGKNLTSGFPDVKSRGGEVVVIVARPWGRIWGRKGGNGNGVPTPNDWGILGPGAKRIHVPTLREWGIHES